MDKALDMSLEDIIKSKKSAVRGNRGSGIGPRGRGARGGSFSGGRLRGTVRGSGRQAPLGVNTRPSSSAIAKPFRRTKNFPRQCDLLTESLLASGLPGMETGTKLSISNLDQGVSNDDIRELFSEIGELKRYAIHYDKSGRASGSAEVVYTRRSDAFAAHMWYNNVQLDGRPMQIEVASPEVPVSTHVNVVGGANGKSTKRVVMTHSGGRCVAPTLFNRGVGQRNRGGLRNGQGHTQNQRPTIRQSKWGGPGRGRGRKQVKSAEDLDKDLEDYHAGGKHPSEGMETDV